jgi:multidrug efflux system outer membrane protein
VIPVPHKNLVQLVNLPANSNKAKAVDAIDAASSARVASAQEAQAIKQAQPTEKATFKPTAVVDVNNDGKTDAAVGVVTEKTTFNDTSVEQVPVTQIVEP